ncbi:MAG: hypothetical protein K1X56_01475 [Flavobacteriales bacterium]|nr:hypothetical protein [Flavobacteriales bacterium]
MKRILFFSIFLAACFSEKKTEENTSAPPQKVQDSVNHESYERRTFHKDSLVDFSARYISGLKQNARSAFSAFEQEDFWKRYSELSEKNWNTLKEERLQPMQQWAKDSFKLWVNDTLPLFYPLSGPDYLHPEILYPGTTTFIFCALEPIIDLPDLLQLNKENRELFLQSVDNSLRDIYGKSYFITTHMQEDFKSNRARGVLPVFYVFIARTGHEILECSGVGIDTSGVLHDTLLVGNTSNWVKGVRFRFRHPDSDTLKELFYFSMDVSEKGQKVRPGFDKYLAGIGKFNTMIKSASYMPHYSTFATLRNRILSGSASIFQDDTGVPYKYFKNTSEWETILFGEYIHPVKDFKDYVFQKDLDSLYKSGFTIHDLPFHLGYHYADKKQSQQIFIRKQ